MRSGPKRPPSAFRDQQRNADGGAGGGALLQLLHKQIIPQLGKKGFGGGQDLIVDQHPLPAITPGLILAWDWASETDHNKCMMRGQQCRGNLVCERQTQCVVQKKAKTNQLKGQRERC